MWRITHPQQIVRTYRGFAWRQRFEADVQTMAREGYLVHSQSYGGMRPGGLFRAGGQPREITVVYVRSE